MSLSDTAGDEAFDDLQTKVLDRPIMMRLDTPQSIRRAPKNADTDSGDQEAEEKVQDQEKVSKEKQVKEEVSHEEFTEEIDSLLRDLGMAEEETEGMEVDGVPLPGRQTSQSNLRKSPSEPSIHSLSETPTVGSITVVGDEDDASDSRVSSGSSVTYEEDVCDCATDERNDNKDGSKETEKEEEKRSKKEHEQEQRETDVAARADIFTEILMTERSYVADLRLIMDVFLTPIRSRELLDPKQISSLFSNIEALLPVNETLLRLLDSTNSHDRIGQIFLEHGDMFKFYAVYCSNQPKIRSYIAQYRAEIPAFNRFLRKCMTMPKCRKLDFESFLIMPLQRLCKYPLFLREMLRHTGTDHSDFNELSEAANKIMDIVSKVNNRVRIVEAVTRLMEVENQLENPEEFGIVDYSRSVVHEGHAKVNGSSRYLFCFNDCLLLCRSSRKHEGKYLGKKLIPFGNACIGQEHQAGSEEIKFELYDGKKLFELSFDKESQRNLWCKVMSKQIMENMENEAEVRSSFAKAKEKHQLRKQSKENVSERRGSQELSDEEEDEDEDEEEDDERNSESKAGRRKRMRRSMSAKTIRNLKPMGEGSPLSNKSQPSSRRSPHPSHRREAAQQQQQQHSQEMTMAEDDMQDSPVASSLRDKLIKVGSSAGRRLSIYGGSPKDKEKEKEKEREAESQHSPMTAKRSRAKTHTFFSSKKQQSQVDVLTMELVAERKLRAEAQATARELEAEVEQLHQGDTKTSSGGGKVVSLTDRMVEMEELVGGLKLLLDNALQQNLKLETQLYEVRSEMSQLKDQVKELQKEREEEKSEATSDE